MNSLKDQLKNILSDSPSGWKENAENRFNQPWLRKYSSQIARRILATIEDNEELNQKKLAELLNVSSQQVSKIIKGRENLTLESIYKISSALGVELISFPEYKYSAKLDNAQTFIPGLDSYYDSLKQIVNNMVAFKGYDQTYSTNPHDVEELDLAS